jgi:hypothetical protein
VQAATLKTFTSDGCSSSPDGLFFVNEFVECCINHDLQYWKGGSEEERLQADSDFKMCMGTKTLPEVADIYYNSVRVGGNPALQAPWAWGYGWSPLPSAHALTKSEQKEVQAKIPNMALPIPLIKTYETELAKITAIKIYLSFMFDFTPETVGSIHRVIQPKLDGVRAVQDVPVGNYFMVTSGLCPQGYYIADTTELSSGVISLKAFGSCSAKQP